MPEHPFKFAKNAIRRAENRFLPILPHFSFAQLNVAGIPRYDFVPAPEPAPASCNSSAESAGLTDRAGCRT